MSNGVRWWFQYLYNYPFIPVLSYLFCGNGGGAEFYGILDPRIPELFISGCLEGVRRCQEGARKVSDGVWEVSDGLREVSYCVRKVSDVIRRV